MVRLDFSKLEPSLEKFIVLIYAHLSPNKLQRLEKVSTAVVLPFVPVMQIVFNARLGLPKKREAKIPIYCLRSLK